MPTTRLFPIGPSPATTATASTRPVAPFFLDPIEALDHSDQSIFQDQPRGRQWRATVVGQRAAHCGAVATDHHRRERSVSFGSRGDPYCRRKCLPLKMVPASRLVVRT